VTIFNHYIIEEIWLLEAWGPLCYVKGPGESTVHVYRIAGIQFSRMHAIVPVVHCLYSCAYFMGLIFVDMRGKP
jgi:hypothetical protein